MRRVRFYRHRYGQSRMAMPGRARFVSHLLLVAVASLIVLPEALATHDYHGTTLTPSEKQWLADHPKIRVAPDPDFPPIEQFDESGRYQGIAADYLKLIEERLGIEFEILHPKSWDEALELVKSRRADVLAAAMKSPQRAEYMRFTDAHIRLPGVILARAGTRESLSLSDLVGMKVAVVSGYVWQDLITNDYPGISLQPVPDIRTGLKKVSFGTVDAMVGDPATTTYYIQQDGITNLRIAGESGYTYELAIASRKDWPQFNSILNKTLSGISHEEKNAILHRWVRLDNAAPPLSRRLWTLLLAGVVIVGAALATILLSAYLWNRSLRRQVEDRTKQLNLELAQRVRGEEELKQLNETLDQRVQERTAQLEGLNDSLKQEIIERKHAEDMQADLGRVLESSLNEVYIFNAETLCFIEVNRGARENLGYSMEELRRMSPLDLKPEYTSESFAEMVRPLRTGAKESQVFTAEHIRKDGTRYPVEVHLQLNRLGSTPVFVAIILDITARRESEAGLKQAMAAAEAASHAKSEFLANMSHELRTPMTAILGYADLLRDPGQTPEQRQDSIHTISRNGEHLLTIINDILDLSKIEAGKIDLENASCSPIVMVAEIADLMRDRATRKGLAFVIDYEGSIPSAIVTDATRLRQILVNLISNAIKFTRSGEVRLTVCMADPSDQKPEDHVPCQRHGPRHDPATDRKALPAILAGGYLYHPQVRGHRAGPGDLTAAGRPAGRRTDGPEPLPGGFDVHMYRGHGLTSGRRVHERR